MNFASGCRKVAARFMPRTPLSPTEMVVRDIVVLGTLASDSMDVPNLLAEYPMITREDSIPESTMRDCVERLLSAGLIRYASTSSSRVEVHPLDVKDGRKWYTITPKGCEMMEDLRSIGRRCGLIPTEPEDE